MHHEFGQHGIKIRRDRCARCHAAIKAYARTRRCIEQQNLAGVGHKSRVGIFRQNAALDRVTAELDFGLL